MAAHTNLQLSHSRWVALALAIVAYLSLHKFPGLSGTLGAVGWVLMAAVVYRHPSVLNFGAPPSKGSWLTAIAFGAALLLVVGSVVAWSLER